MVMNKINHMKKIIIDHFVFNKAILNKKFEVAEFLIECECPRNYTAYLQRLEVPVFEWLSRNNIAIDEPNFSLYLLEKTEDKVVLDWFFLVKKIPISQDTMSYCINNDRLDLVRLLLEYGYSFKNTDYITAFKKGNMNILALLKEKKCPFDEKVEKTALSMGNKEILKWCIKNELM